MEWITSRERKVHQKHMTKALRMLNKNIENDNLWKGRFYIRQIQADWHRYEDGSGGELYVRFKLFDKVTGITKESKWDTVNHWLFGNGWDLWWLMNNFIVEDVDVWRSEKTED